MNKMHVYCGTCMPESFSFDLNDYGTIADDYAVDPIDQAKAWDLLSDTMNDQTFADDGYRNNDAVNACIALHVLGYNAKEWFENFCKEQRNVPDRWFQADLNKFLDHVERVSKYLYRWGPADDRGAALGYALD